MGGFLIFRTGSRDCVAESKSCISALKRNGIITPTQKMHVHTAKKFRLHTEKKAPVHTKNEHDAYAKYETNSPAARRRRYSGSVLADGYDIGEAIAARPQETPKQAKSILRNSRAQYQTFRNETTAGESSAF